MGDIKGCRQCGAELVPGDKFCGDCGSPLPAAAESGVNGPLPANPMGQASPPANAGRQPAAAPLPSAAPVPPPVRGLQPGNVSNLGRSSGVNKNTLLIIFSLLGILFLAAGGIYWWISRGEETGKAASSPIVNQDKSKATTGGQSGISASAPAVDLTRAAAYLPEPGLKATFFVNYPDGMAGVVERISARVVSNEAVRVSEVETGVEQGEAFGFGFHYVERADGTYYIPDQTPDEIFPVLKNNLSVGQTWNYQDEFGRITWTVADIGVDLNLGFTIFEDCLLVKEDNQAAGFQSVTYYAPGRGSVLVRDPSGGTEYYKMTAMTLIDAAQAADTVKKWSPNYALIKDDRTQY
ncbi:MAG TPA: zinc ribbon domain-containing protein [Desulfitobacteriaceae bacterium]|nr:zinc ribbon domain-containing protein [Desulfitobacteriaceae bacterium]